MNSNSHEPRVAIVTGGSRGIGRAIAVALAQQGWHVCISYLNNEAAAAETAALVPQNTCPLFQAAGRYLPSGPRKHRSSRRISVPAVALTLRCKDE